MSLRGTYTLALARGIPAKPLDDVLRGWKLLLLTYTDIRWWLGLGGYGLSCVFGILVVSTGLRVGQSRPLSSGGSALSGEVERSDNL